MSDFHEVSFPFPVALGASGGPERRTDIVTRVSGREERNTPWADSRRRWDAGPGVRSLDDVETLLAFFEARRGPLHGFRFRDPLDHRSCAPSVLPSAMDQTIGSGDGVTTRFALTKTYESGGEHWIRRISKPVADSLLIALDGVETPVSLEAVTGEIVFDTPPVPGAVISAGFLFDCPVRFDSDRLEIALDHVAAGSAFIPLIELRL